MPQGMAGPGAERTGRDDRLVERTLQVGLAIGLGLMLAGLLVDAGSGALDARPVRLGALGASMPLGTRLAALGVLALGLTPASRVVLLVMLWGRERDWRFVAVAGVVLAVLAAALFAGVG